jgi:hypothetical protein
MVQPVSRLSGTSRNTACHPLALAIGLAVGETPFFDASFGAVRGLLGRLAQYFR